MRLNRVGWGAVAGTMGMAAAFAASVLVARLGDWIDPGRSLGAHAREQQVFWIVFVVVGCGVFWLADWLGIVSPPYQSPMSLRGGRDADEDVPGGVKPPDLDGI